MSTKDTIHFYWDPGCPWAYVTSLWVREVAQLRGMTVRWPLYSLRIKNTPPDGKAPEKPSMGLRVLRVAAAIRESVSEDAVGDFYAEAARRRHTDRADIGEDDELKSILEACGLDVGLVAEKDNERWDEAVRADMATAEAKAGNDVGVPIIVLDDGEGPAWFGPVISRAPRGDEALALWDAYEKVARLPGFFELKRGRTERPVIE